MGAGNPKKRNPVKRVLPHSWSAPEAIYDLYAAHNKRYFGGKLPADALLLLTTGFPDYHCGVAHQDQHGRAIITLNAHILENRREFGLTLLHEMAHFATWAEEQDHGPRWQRTMRRLAREGAFDDLW